MVLRHEFIEVEESRSRASLSCTTCKHNVAAAELCRRSFPDN